LLKERQLPGGGLCYKILSMKKVLGRGKKLSEGERNYNQMWTGKGKRGVESLKKAVCLKRTSLKKGFEKLSRKWWRALMISHRGTKLTFYRRGHGGRRSLKEKRGDSKKYTGFNTLKKGKMKRSLHVGGGGKKK